MCNWKINTVDERAVYLTRTSHVTSPGWAPRTVEVVSPGCSGVGGGSVALCVWAPRLTVTQRQPHYPLLLRRAPCGKTKHLHRQAAGPGERGQMWIKRGGEGVERGGGALLCYEEKQNLQLIHPLFLLGLV